MQNMETISNFSHIEGHGPHTGFPNMECQAQESTTSLKKESD